MKERLYQLGSVTKVYGDGPTAVRALDGIDLDIDIGEFVVVIGASGSGKSTMLQLLGALDRPSSGSIGLEGQNLAALSEPELARLRLNRLGFVFQQFNLIPTLSAQENVEAAIAPRGLSSAERARVAAEMLGRVGLGERADHLPSELSGGEQQRVAIARSLANGPDVLLADEPTGNLDTTTGEAILELLESLWRDGLSVVVITHDQAIAERAPRVVRLADGRIAGNHPPAIQDNEGRAAAEMAVAAPPSGLPGNSQASSQ